MQAQPSSIIFIYNAKSGIINGLADVLHRTFSPSTYPCKLCDISYGPLRMKPEWKKFLDETGYEYSFFLSDQFKKKYGFLIPSLPSIYMKQGREWKVLMDKKDFEPIQSIEQLIQVLDEKIKTVEWTEIP